MRQAIFSIEVKPVV
jgi:hypothetical protein